MKKPQIKSMRGLKRLLNRRVIRSAGLQAIRVSGTRDEVEAYLLIALNDLQELRSSKDTYSELSRIRRRWHRLACTYGAKEEEKRDDD